MSQRNKHENEELGIAHRYIIHTSLGIYYSHQATSLIPRGTRVLSSHEFRRLRWVVRHAYIPDRHKKTHHAHQTAQASRITTADCTTAKLGLNKQLHNGHCGAIDGVLLGARRTTSGLVEQLGRLRHRHADELRLRAAATATGATRGELFQDLESSIKNRPPVISHGTGEATE